MNPGGHPAIVADARPVMKAIGNTGGLGGVRRPRFIIAALLVTTAFAAIIAVAMLPTHPALLLRDAQGARLAAIPLKDGAFTHEYVHSIHKTPVQEFFRVRPESGTLGLYRLEYDSYGVGMPSDGGDAFRLENGRFIVDLHREFDSLPIRVSPVPGDGIRVDGMFHPFTEWVREGELVIISGIRSRRLRFGTR